jgi:hypothetical protein
MKIFMTVFLFLALSIGSVLQANAFASHQFMDTQSNEMSHDMSDCHKEKSDKKKYSAKCFSFCNATTIAKMLTNINSLQINNSNIQLDTYFLKKYSIKLPNPERPPIS